MPFDVKIWAEIRDNHNGTLLLGSGASIAVNNSFTYGFLREHAIEQACSRETFRGCSVSSKQKILNWFYDLSGKRLTSIGLSTSRTINHAPLTSACGMR
jgi:hypothetical protein